MEPKQSSPRRGVGAYLALAFTVLSILLTVLLVQVIGTTASRELKSTIGHGLEELALQTADKLDRGMYERYREVWLMAQRVELAGRGQSVEDKRRLLDERQRTYPDYAWIGITDNHGKVVAATGKMLEGADVSARPWFSDARNGIHVGDVHEAVLLAKMLPARPEPMRFVDIAFPYFGADGAALGVLAVHLSWEWARGVERSIIEPTEQRRKVEALIVDRQGKVLLGPPDVLGETLRLQSVAAAARDNGYVSETWPDGRRYLVGYSASNGHASYTGLGWTVLVRQEADEAFLPVTHIQRRVLLSGIALALLFSVLGLIAARRISRPLRELAASAERAQPGGSVTLPMADAYAEVRVLSTSLNTLLAGLQQKEADLKELNQHLERRVAERTAELQQALAEVGANERRIRSIIEAAQDAYVGVDLNGNIIDWNSQAERMFGWSRQEVLGQPLATQVLPPRFRPSLERTLERFAAGASLPQLNQRLERTVVNRAGMEFPVEVTIALAGDTGAHFFSAFLHDISERKKVEQMKSEFVSTVSHELRTPLTSIRGSLTLLTSGLAGEVPPDAKGLLDISQQSCERLVRLVNDVLDIEKIESGNMDLNIGTHALRPQLENAVAGIAGYARQYGVTLQLDVDPAATQVQADRDRLAQVLDNLLSNAIKFSPAGGTVFLKAVPSASGVRISVADQGEGIAPEFHGRIFQKFAQADSTNTRRKGGTGLGLSICKSIVEQHGGNIGFESAPGQGTTFHVDLPA